MLWYGYKRLARSGISVYQIIYALPTNQTQGYSTFAYQRQTGAAMVIIQLSCKTNRSATGTVQLKQLIVL